VSVALFPLHHLLTALIVFQTVSSVARWRRIALIIALKPWEWAALAGLFAGALALRLLLPPEQLVHTGFHSLYFLENALGPRAVDAAELAGRAPYGLTNYTLFQLFWAYLPRTWQVCVSLHAVLASATVVYVYMIVRLLAGDPIWAVASSLTLALLPAHVKGSATESDIIVCSFFAMMALVNWLAAVRSGSRLLLCGTAAALVLAVHGRILTLAFPVAIVTAWFVLDPSLRRPPGVRWMLPAFGLTAVLTAPQYVHVWNILRSSAAWGPMQVHGLPTAFLLSTSQHTSLLFSPAATSAAIPLLVAAGAVLLVLRRRWRGALLVVGTVAIFLLYHQMSENVLDQLRYQFFIWPFLAIVAGFAAEEAWTRGRGVPLRGAVLGAAVVVPSLSLIASLDFVRADPPSSREAKFVMDSMQYLPTGARLVHSQIIPTAVGPAIPPLYIPRFLLADADRGLGVAALGEVPDDCGRSGPPLLIYVGLQSYSFRDGEGCPPSECFRMPPDIDALPCGLSPLRTSVIDTSGPSPDPGLELRSAFAEIGFYQLTAGRSHRGYRAIPSAARRFGSGDRCSRMW